MRLFSLLMVSILVFACTTTEEVVSPSTDKPMDANENPPADNSKPQRNALVKSTLGSFEESDPLNIDSLRVSGNTLFMYVNYGGGCKEHQFKVIGSTVVMKSLPPKRMIQLVHDNEDDPCKSIVSRVLEVDLRNLAYDATPGSEIILLLKGSENEIHYIYE